MSTSVEQDLRQIFDLVARLRQHGRFEEAVACAVRGVEQACTALGEGHPATVISLSNLAGLHLDMGAFDTALPLAAQAVALGRRLGDGSHLILATPLNQLAVIHRERGRFGEAIALLEEALAISRQALGHVHPELAVSLDNLATAYKEVGDFQAAESRSREALAIAGQTLGADHPTTATILSNQAMLCQATGDYLRARSLHQQALAIRRAALGDQHPHVALSLDELGLLHQKFGEHELAEPLHREALEIVRGAFGDDHPEVATCLSNLAMLYRATARYRAAEPLYVRALAIRRKAFDSSHPAVAGSLNNLALLHRAAGNYLAARPLFEESLAINRQALGPGALEVAIGLDNLASLCADMGEYAGAEALCRQALDIRRDFFGERHPEVADSLNNLALLCQKTGNYGAVEPLYRQALAIHRDATGDQGVALATVLNNLAMFHRATGNHAAAEPLYRQSLAIRRHALGDDHPDVADSLGNLAILYGAMGDSAAAQALHLQALATMTRSVGDEHPAVATFAGNLATLYRSIGRLAEAERLQARVLDIRRRMLGPDHVDIALSMNELAGLRCDRGDFDAAEPLFRQALAIRRAVLGEEHPDVAVVLGNLAGLCVASNRADEALALMQQEAGILDRVVRHIFSIGSERQRLAYLASLAGTMESFLSLVLRHHAGRATAVLSAFDLVLRRKAIGAEALALQRDQVLGGHHPALRSLLDESTELRRQIAGKTLAGPGPEGEEAHRESLAQWSARRERLESELTRQIPEVHLEQRLRSADRHAVAGSLPPGSALVEFVRCDIHDFHALPAKGERSWLPARYLAFVLLAGSPDRVCLLDLGDAARIDALIARFRESVAVPPQSRAPAEADAGMGMELRAAVFDPLLPALEGRTLLFIAPDGDLSRVPFEVLRTAAGRFLIDDYRIGYLGVGRDAVRFGAAPSCAQEAPIVAASPDFELCSSPGQDPDVGPARADRRSQDLERGDIRFEPLPGTRLEGRSVAALLGVEPWLEGEVLEARLKACRSPSVLHLATHGYFLPNQPRSLDAPPGCPGGAEVDTPLDAQGRLAAAENPLLRSGLALAGVNTWSRGGRVPIAAEDGLLTAEDVTGMDLLGTDLVVLSACETGLGDVLRGEGVFGLRRSFLLAGAKAVVISLWQVPDEATRHLMEDFYRRLTDNDAARRSPGEALRAAQLLLKNDPPTADPYFWGAFICEGRSRQGAV